MRHFPGGSSALSPQLWLSLAAKRSRSSDLGGPGRGDAWSAFMLPGGDRGRRVPAGRARMIASAACAIPALTMAALIVMALATTAMSVMSRAAELGVANGRIGGGAGSATMESALIQAYQNNPQLNAQRAATRATDENVADGAVGLSPARERDGEPDRTVSGHADQGADRRRPRLYSDHGRRRSAELRSDRHADAVQRLPDRKPHAPGRGPGVLRARDAAHDRADRAAQRRHGLHEPAARPRRSSSCSAAT